jgi:hypothetical protein
LASIQKAPIERPGPVPQHGWLKLYARNLAVASRGNDGFRK